MTGPGEVAVIGAAGHMGLGFSLVLANAGYLVHGVDVDEATVVRIMSGRVPYIEEGAEPILERVLATDSLRMGNDLSVVSRAKYIAVQIGTTPDEHLTPRMDALYDLADDLAPYLEPGHVLMLRSTLVPGTTDNLARQLARTTGLEVGRDLHLACHPERSVQGRSICEMPTLPSVIGAYTREDFDIVSQFCRTYSSGACLRVTPLEAEFAKLMTNAARYVQFALSNEFALISAPYDVNINRIMEAANTDYPRLDLPTPGLNVGGPCLYKDSLMLADGIPWSTLTGTAMGVNESMPALVVRGLGKYPGVRKVAVLGMTFKAGSDDTRNSLGPKLRDRLRNAGYAVVCVEPNLEGYDDLQDIAGSDAVVLMTPHDEFGDWNLVRAHAGNPGCVYVDIWGRWEQIRYRTRGGFWQDGAEGGGRYEGAGRG